MKHIFFTLVAMLLFAACSNSTQENTSETVQEVQDTSKSIFRFTPFQNFAILTGVNTDSSILVVPERVFIGSRYYNVVEVGDNAFKGSKADTIILPETLSQIGDGSFSDCKNLKSIEIPAGVESIGNSAFYGCCSLTDITIPEGVSSIEPGTFYMCTSLSSVNLHHNLSFIYDEAFYGCKSLKKLTIPSSVSDIGRDAFMDCENLDVFVEGDSDDYDSEFERLRFYDEDGEFFNPFIGCKSVEFEHSVSDTVNGYEFVDLGLPSGLKWATKNIGANTILDLGFSFVWGELSPKSSGEFGYPRCKTIEDLKSAGIIDSANTLTKDYDAATKNWGDKWRIPTRAEIQELMDNCTWIKQEYPGTEGQVLGYYVISKSNRNWIYLPYDNMGYLYYWSSTLKDSSLAYNIEIGKWTYICEDKRESGARVRPVLSK